MEPRERQKLRLFYSLRDFQLALSALDFYLEVDEGQHYSVIQLRRFRCYLDEAVISYCRPFTTASGLPLLSFKRIGLKPTQEQHALHDQLMAYRHKVVAHSDLEKMRMAVSSFKAFDDKDLWMPILNTDEGLEFLPDRMVWLEWLRALIGALSEVTFEMVQTAGEGFLIHQDHRKPGG